MMTGIRNLNSQIKYRATVGAWPCRRIFGHEIWILVEIDAESAAIEPLNLCHYKIQSAPSIQESCLLVRICLQLWVKLIYIVHFRDSMARRDSLSFEKGSVNRCVVYISHHGGRRHASFRFLVFGLGFDIQFTYYDILYSKNEMKRFMYLFHSWANYQFSYQN
eukprot:SAG22_NODE_10846_length_513_cov_1.188406_1_plen_163_part_00